MRLIAENVEDALRVVCFVALCISGAFVLACFGLYLFSLL